MFYRRFGPRKVLPSSLNLALVIPLFFVLTRAQAAPLSACEGVQNTLRYTFVSGPATVNRQAAPEAASSPLTIPEETSLAARP